MVGMPTAAPAWMSRAGRRRHRRSAAGRCPSVPPRAAAAPDAAWRAAWCRRRPRWPRARPARAGPHQRLGQPRRLVGNDAPAHATGVELIEQLGDAGKQHRIHAQRRRVVGQEFQAHRLVVGRLGRDAEAAAEQAARAGRGERAQLLERCLGQAAIALHPVDRAGQVGRRIGERAVEVEQDRLAGGEIGGRDGDGGNKRGGGRAQALGRRDRGGQAWRRQATR